MNYGRQKQTPTNVSPSPLRKSPRRHRERYWHNRPGLYGVSGVPHQRSVRPGLGACPAVSAAAFCACMRSSGRERAAKIFAKKQDLRGSMRFVRRSGGVGSGVGGCGPSLGVPWCIMSGFVSPSLLQAHKDPHFGAIDDDRACCCKGHGEIGPGDSLTHRDGRSAR